MSCKYFPCAKSNWNEDYCTMCEEYVSKEKLTNNLDFKETQDMDVSTTEIKLDDLLDSPADLSPAIYQYYNCLNNRKIVFNGEVDEDILETVALPLLSMENDGSGKPVELIISSPGGSVVDGMYVCDIIDQYSIPLTITCLGYAYSLGGLLLMAGKDNPNVYKRAYRFSTALIHSGDAYIAGNANSVDDTFHFYKALSNAIKDYILSHTTISLKEYNKMQKSEWYMMSDEMLKHGIIDEIIGVNQSVEEK